MLFCFDVFIMSFVIVIISRRLFGGVCWVEVCWVEMG